jgi:hypothetical protein
LADIAWPILLGRYCLADIAWPILLGIPLANSATIEFHDISHWPLTIIGQKKSRLCLTDNS